MVTETIKSTDGISEEILVEKQKKDNGLYSSHQTAASNRSKLISYLRYNEICQDGI